jgi:hypothetical protein
VVSSIRVSLQKSMSLCSKLQFLLVNLIASTDSLYNLHSALLNVLIAQDFPTYRKLVLTLGLTPVKNLRNRDLRMR